MRIGIDIESGESPFHDLVNGALNSIQDNKNIFIYLIGNSQKIINAFPAISKTNNVFLINANEVIYMDESPISSIKRKPNATVIVGMRMLKENRLDAFFSPGNTGATVAAAVINLGIMNGIKKPAMATFFPRTDRRETLVLDIGANPDANEENIFHNAILGIAYYKLIFNNQNPSVGLLNIGEEFGKGTSLIKKAFNNLSSLSNFIGNVEGYSVFNGSVDIVVCSGFLGNSILKIAEALKKFFISVLKDTFFEVRPKSVFGDLLYYLFSRFGIYTKKKKLLNQRLLPKYFGAAPLLGVNGMVLIGHGSSSGKEVTNTIEFAYYLYKLNYLIELNSYVKKILKKD